MRILNHLNGKHIEMKISKRSWALPVSWLLAVGADGCLEVMADADPVGRAAHLQTGVLGGIWA